VVILRKYAGSEYKDTLASGSIEHYRVKDQISLYAKESVQWAVSKNLLSGTAYGLEPKASLTRAQMAVILKNYSALPYCDIISWSLNQGSFTLTNKEGQFFNYDSSATERSGNLIAADEYLSADRFNIITPPAIPIPFRTSRGTSSKTFDSL